MLRIVLPPPLSDVLNYVYVSLVMHTVAMVAGNHRAIGGLGIAAARQVTDFTNPASDIYTTKY